MKNQIILVLAAMLFTVFVVPAATLTLILNVGITALLLTTLVPLAGEAINLHIDNRVRLLHSKKIVVKENDGYPTK